MTAAITPLEALRRCIEAMKEVDFIDVGADDRRWHKLNEALGVAEGVVRDYVEPEPVAWMTDDGRVSTDETKRTGMARTSRENFNIPLYRAPVAAQPSEAAVLDSDIFDLMVEEGVAYRDEKRSRILMFPLNSGEIKDCIKKAIVKFSTPPAAVSAAPSGEVERDAVAEAIFKVIKPSNMTDKDWKNGAILGFENSFRDQVNEAAKAAIAAITSAKE